MHRPLLPTTGHATLPAPGETVVLQTELRSPTGRVLEIGERLTVVACDGARVELETDGDASTDRIVCPCQSVASERVARLRQATPWYRRRDAAAA